MSGSSDVHFTIESLIRRSAQQLSEQGIEDPLFEARLLFEDSTGISLVEQLTNSQRKLKAEQIEKFLAFVESRKRRTPYAYITEHADFYGREFNVKDCLIPRPETELVVDLVLNNFQNWFNRKCNILDLCTGSGCLGLTLYLELESELELNLTLSDISNEALRTCKLNYNTYCESTDKVEIVQADLFPIDQAFAFQYFDLIVANPPYIKTEDINELSPEVASYEPHLALDGGQDGLNFYRRISKEIKPFIQHDVDTILVVEHGTGQRKNIKEIFYQTDLIIKEIIEVDDWQGHDRILAFIINV